MISLEDGRSKTEDKKTVLYGPNAYKEPFSPKEYILLKQYAHRR